MRSYVYEKASLLGGEYPHFSGTVTYRKATENKATLVLWLAQAGIVPATHSKVKHRKSAGISLVTRAFKEDMDFYKLRV